MKRVILTKGLPASGKTTWAKTLLRKKKGAWVRVSLDDLEAMCFDGWRFSLEKASPTQRNEAFLMGMRDLLILKALENNQHVLVDEMNLADDSLDYFTKLVEGLATVEVEDRFLSVSVEECVKRDLQRPNSLGERAIRKIYRKYLQTSTSPPAYLEGRPDCIIVDMDGTLALLNGRSPYEAQKCDTDLPNEPVVETVKKWQEAVDVVICSGRTDDAKEKTVDWLRSYGIEFKALHMRQTGDMRKDAVIKEEIYRDRIEGKYNVKFVLDDRNQVVELWRGLGLTVFQVAEGDF
ncbi:MAG: polynucleotide kinase [Leptolyngbya foveolarum]|uniref:Polynucleotide kinase n=1 Tax=Leptolyngbya foveolarum TaxID=47253 RepID=A0A2W4VKN8_9CYAN|nr:MAG: polynucleotide kinase [Leptolyngbya foveolarum]